METGNLLHLVIKTFIIVLLFIYFLVSVLIARQVFLMNRAIRTKLAGCLNLLSILHIFLVLAVMVLIVILV
ncbi:hypothetical protein JW766_01130 [Candidatus Dojkabacteria bacterium]|nr:hypothetical protein [Candidatus Dojkabacteria bacterium]